MSDNPWRIEEQVVRPAPVEIRVDGETIVAYSGESLAAALLAAGRRAFRQTARSGELRGPVCNMGVCFDCVVDVNGKPLRACMTPVQAGMNVTTGIAA